MELRQLIGQVLDEKYLIEKELGKGGMGAVYLAMHIGTDRPVALKVIAPQFMQHAEFVERFKREARAAGRLRHPNVVDVTDFGFARVGSERVAYLVMEYLDGCTLGEVLAEETRLPVDWVVDILEQTCAALDEAHRQGIIHRDLKPDNIWLEPNHRGGYTVKVLDFGIAKLADTTARPASDNALNASSSSNSSSSSTSSSNSTSSSASSSSSASGVSSPSLSQELPTLIEESSHVSGQASANSASQDSGAGRTAGESRRETSSSEAATLLQPAAADDEELSEASTQLIEPLTDGDHTRLLEQRTQGERRLSQTVSTDGLTQIGATLGTPFYMSPEQWRGETLDTRADIYSLGIIAYQMLSGGTPFKGDFLAVKRQHQEEPPPPLNEKRVPHKVARTVMSALAKNPAERPPTAGAFASALRAHAEGAGRLLRHALALYSEHLPVFLRVTALIFLPVFVLNILQIVLGVLTTRKLLPQWLIISTSVVLSLLTMLFAFTAAAILIGVTTRIVTQLLAAPLRPIQLRAVFAALRKRLRPLLTTALLVSFMTTFGMLMCLLPGIFVMLNYSLVTPVMMMEETKGRAALKRSRELSRRSWRTVALVIFIQVVMPVLTSGLLAFLIYSLVKALQLQGSRASLFSHIYQIISFPITVLVASFSALITALLYLKTRQAGGETLREALGQFEDEELPRSNWQMRMRSRLHMTTRGATRHTS
ncbi:MAG TPA: bifunctional serine/threonine protein kinase/MFS transporter [Pyrinomonadaceae bacterium]|jgi:serine/threonine protein kinase